MPAFEAVLLPSSLSLPLPLSLCPLFPFSILHTRARVRVYINSSGPVNTRPFLPRPSNFRSTESNPPPLPSLLFSPPFTSFILFFFPFPLSPYLSLSLSFFFIHRLASMASLHRAPEQIGISAGGDVLVKRNKLSPS